MGYISEVAVAINPDVYDSFYNSLPESSKELLDFSKIYKNEYGVLIYWSSIKWYYESVDHFMKYLRMIDLDKWFMIEIGEDADHNTELGEWIDNPFELSIRRSIEMSV